MRFVIIIILLVGALSCTVINKNQVTVYGKITENHPKFRGVIFASDGEYRLDKIGNWHDSLLNQYVEVTGYLTIKKNPNANDTNTNVSGHFVGKTIRKPKISYMNNDSIKDIIDTSHGKCAEFRYLLNIMQLNKTLDSLTSSDSIVFLSNTKLLYKIPLRVYTHNGSKTIYFMVQTSINNSNVKEYFELVDFRCEFMQDYNFRLVYYKCVGDTTIKNVFQIIGNRNEIRMMLLE